MQEIADVKGSATLNKDEFSVFINSVLSYEKPAKIARGSKSAEGESPLELGDLDFKKLSNTTEESTASDKGKKNRFQIKNEKSKSFVTPGGLTPSKKKSSNRKMM